jgi:hypothetical protein
MGSDQQNVCPACQARMSEVYVELAIMVPQSVFDWLNAKAEAGRTAEYPDWDVEDEATVELMIAMDIAIEIALQDAEEQGNA